MMGEKVTTTTAESSRAKLSRNSIATTGMRSKLGSADWLVPNPSATLPFTISYRVCYVSHILSNGDMANHT